MNLHMGRPQLEETSESPVLEKSDFCERQNSMLSFEKYDQILTQTPLQSKKKKKNGNKSRKFNCCLSISPICRLVENSETIKILIGNDPLVHEFNKSHKILKLQKSAKHTENYKLIVAKLEGKL